MVKSWDAYKHTNFLHEGNKFNGKMSREVNVRNYASLSEEAENDQRGFAYEELCQTEARNEIRMNIDG